MKIIYLHQYYNNPSMSGGTRSYEMARKMAINGHEVHIVTSWRSGTLHKSWFVTKESGFIVHWLPVAYSNHMNLFQRLKAFFHYALKAGRKARQIGGDLVFASSTPLTIALPGVFASQKLNIPMVFEVRDLWPEIPIAVGALKNFIFVMAAKWLEKYAYRNAAHIIALSPGMKEGVIRAGYPEDQISVIPNGADLDLFSPGKADVSQFLSDKPELIGKKIVVYAGAFGLMNGVSYAIEMAAKLAIIAPDIVLVLVGEGAEKRKVIQLAEEKQLFGRSVFIYSQIKKKDVPLLLAVAHISLSLFINMEVLWANSANKFFDGLASGTPMAINYVGWQAEIIQKNGCGIVLPALAPDKAAMELREFIYDTTRLKSAGVAARDLAEKAFSRDLHAIKFEEVLSNVITGQG